MRHPVAHYSTAGHSSSKPGHRTSQPTWRYFVYVRKSSEPDDRQAMSIDSQKHELKERFPELSIVDVIEESRTAKSPGRPLFDSMMARIEAGEAQGIVAWHPDRLSRNSVDAGAILYSLDRGKLADLKFVHYTFENTPEGKLMLSMILSQSKYFVDKLTVDVLRGIRARLERGWLPGRPPLGYLNHRERATGLRTIIADPDSFPIVQRMWQWMLSGAYNPSRLREIANGDWGLRSPRGPLSGGRPLSLSGVYRMFSNPFYYGEFEYDGRLYPGSHPAMITEGEFWKVQNLLGRQGRARPKRNEAGKRKFFAYTGLIQCPECGGKITAEERWRQNKTDGRNRHYIHYHCSKRKVMKGGRRCRQPLIEVRDLEAQIALALRRFILPEDFMAWALEYARQTGQQDVDTEAALLRSAQEALAATGRQQGVLLDLRLRGLLTDEQFEAKQKLLVEEKARLEKQIRQPASSEEQRFGRLRDTLEQATTAYSRFLGGSEEEKRGILETIGSDFILEDKILRFQPARPFRPLQDVGEFPRWYGVVEDVRKICSETNQLDSTDPGAITHAN